MKMIGRVLRLVGLACLLCGALASASSAHTWSLARDWAVSPDAGTTAPPNPFGDQYGDAHVWSVGYGTGSYESGPQLTGMVNGQTSDWSYSTQGGSGVQGWSDNGTGVWGGAGGYPYVAKNTSGSNFAGIWPDQYVEMHPAPDGNNANRPVVAWTSPITGTVSISAEFISMNSCSAGLDYSVDWQPGAAGIRHIAGGYFPALGAGNYSNPSLAVNGGDTYYFSVGDGATGSYYCDSTQISVTITDDGSSGGSLAFHNTIAGPAGSALKTPEGVTMDGNGSDIVIADSGNNRLISADQNGTSFTTLDPTTNSDPAFNDPRQAVPSPNNFIVSDSGNANIEQINAGGSPGEDPFGSGVTWSLPRGIATTKDQSKVAIADAGNNAVYVFDNSGNLLHTLTSGGSSGTALKEPEGVAFDAGGDVWVADTQNHRLVEYGSDGTELKTLQDDLGNSFYPTGLAVDPVSGNIWVADWQHGQVVEMDQTGATLTTVTNASGSGDHLSGPITVALDPTTGDLYVADSGNNRIVRYTGAGAAPATHTDGFINTSTTDVTVQGRVNPEGRSSYYYVQYGTGATVADLTRSTQAQPLVDNGGTPYTDTSDHTVDVDVTPLTPGQNYCFRLVAFNAMGTSPGEIVCHNTTGPPVPVVSTDTPQRGDVGFEHIDMTGRVNPEGAPASWYFQITPCPDFDYAHCASNLHWTKNFPSKADGSPSPQPLGHSDFSFYVVGATASGLTPATTYYYRVVATNTDTNQSVYDSQVVQARTPTPTLGVGAHYTAASGRQSFIASSPPTFDPGSKVQWDYECSLSGQAVGAFIKSCAGTINGSASTSGSNLPSACSGSSKCKYTVVVDGVDKWGDEVKPTYTYYINPPPLLPAQKQIAKRVQTQVVNQWKPSWWDWLFTGHKDFCQSASGCSDSNALAIVWSNGQVTTANGGQIIAAGSANLYDSNGKQLLINNPALYEIRDSHGVLTGIIGAGSANIIAAGSANIISAGSANFAVLGIVSAGSANIVSAGSANIVSAGSANIVAAGSANIIGAGSANFGAGLQFSSSLYSNINYAKAAPTLSTGTLPMTLTGSAGTQLVSNVQQVSTSGNTNLGSSTGPAADVARAHNLKTIPFASGRITFVQSGEKTMMLLRTTAKGRRAIAAAMKLNGQLKRRHRALRPIKLLVIDTYRPLHGKPYTLRSLISVKPI